MILRVEITMRVISVIMTKLMTIYIYNDDDDDWENISNNKSKKIIDK